MHLQTATAPGTAHVNPGQPGKINNQDVAAIRSSERNNVVVLCDGCGSQPYSGTGADIGANLIANMIFTELENGASVSKFGWNKLTAGIISALRQEVKLFAAGSSIEAFEQAVLERFMFTVMVLAVQDDIAVVAAFGDGVVIVDDEIIMIEPPIINAPPYLGYKLIRNGAYQTDEFRTHLAFSVVKKVKLADLRKSLIIATDGLKDLVEEDWHHPALVQPKQLQRWINSLTTEKIVKGRFIAGKCSDDVTVAIIQTDESQDYLLEERREIATLKQDVVKLKAKVDDFAGRCDREQTYYEKAVGAIEDLEKQLEPLREKAQSFRSVAKEVAALQATLQGLKDQLPREPKEIIVVESPGDLLSQKIRHIPISQFPNNGLPREPKGFIATVSDYIWGPKPPAPIASVLNERGFVDDFEVDDLPHHISGGSRRRYRQVMDSGTLSTHEHSLLYRLEHGISLSAVEEVELERLIERIEAKQRLSRAHHPPYVRGRNGKGARR